MTVLLAAWLVYLDAVIRDKFEGRRWQLPAQVYAQPLELYPGQTLAQSRFISGLDQLGYARVTRVQSPGEFSVSGGGSIFMCVLSVSRMRRKRRVATS